MFMNKSDQKIQNRVLVVHALHSIVQNTTSQILDEYCRRGRGQGMNASLRTSCTVCLDAETGRAYVLFKKSFAIAYFVKDFSVFSILFYYNAIGQYYLFLHISSTGFQPYFMIRIHDRIAFMCYNFPQQICFKICTLSDGSVHKLDVGSLMPFKKNKKIILLSSTGYFQDSDRMKCIFREG